MYDPVTFANPDGPLKMRIQTLRLFVQWNGVPLTGDNHGDTEKGVLEPDTAKWVRFFFFLVLFIIVGVGVAVLEMGWITW